MMYPSLSETAQARIRATVAPAPGVVSSKLRAALEEDHYARTLMGQAPQSVDARLAEVRRPDARNGLR